MQKLVSTKKDYFQIVPQHVRMRCVHQPVKHSAEKQKQKQDEVVRGLLIAPFWIWGKYTYRKGTSV
jgi:hypothetical protein